MIFYNRQNVKNKSFLDLGSRNCTNAVRLFTASIKSRFPQTSDESNAVKLNRTLGPGMWFDCDKHSSQNLEYFLVCDIFYNDSDIHWDLINGSGCQATLAAMSDLESEDMRRRQPPSVLLPSLIFCRFRSYHLFGQFLRLGHYPPVDKRTGLREIDLSDYHCLKIFWLA